MLSTELDHERRIRGNGERAIAREAQVDRKTVRHYLEAAKGLGRGPTDGDDRLAD